MLSVILAAVLVAIVGTVVAITTQDSDSEVNAPTQFGVNAQSTITAETPMDYGRIGSVRIGDPVAVAEKAGFKPTPGESHGQCANFHVPKTSLTALIDPTGKVHRIGVMQGDKYHTRTSEGITPWESTVGDVQAAYPTAVTDFRGANVHVKDPSDSGMELWFELNTDDMDLSDQLNIPFDPDVRIYRMATGRADLYSVADLCEV